MFILTNFSFCRFILTRKCEENISAVSYCMNHSGDDVGWVGCFVAGNPKDE